MSTQNFIPLQQLCTHYQVELSFFTNLSEIGLIEIETIEQSPCLHPDKIIAVEKIIRIHHELEVNIEGIDVIFHLLQKLEEKEIELIYLKNRLGIYEN
ncbi:MAG: MerR family transcriptional regulator [Chitinophagales bacterium]|nr:MerR family transcriptional regulator [Chitinophagales bacterium]